jgi:hypothetical protein
MTCEHCNEADGTNRINMRGVPPWPVCNECWEKILEEAAREYGMIIDD